MKLFRKKQMYLPINVLFDCEFATALTFFERSLQFLLLYNFFRKFHALEIHGYTIYLHLSKTKLHYVEIEPYFVKQDEYIDTNGHS